MKEKLDRLEQDEKESFSYNINYKITLWDVISIIEKKLIITRFIDYFSKLSEFFYFYFS